MCLGVRWIVSRARPSWRMCARVFVARRRRRCFLLIAVIHRLRRTFSAGSRRTAIPRRVAAPAAPKRAPSLLFSFLQGDLLAHVAHALALVGLRGADIADLCGYLADLLHVDAADRDLGLAGGLDGDAFRNREV